MVALYVIGIFISLLASFFFSCADMCYAVVDKTKLKKHAKEGSKTATLALKLSEQYEITISTILFGNNLFNILMSSLITLLSMQTFKEQYMVTVMLIIMTIMVIIFCEFVPKALAKRFSYTFALAFAYPVLIFKKIFFIFVYPIGKLFHLTVTKSFSKKSKEEDVIDEDVLSNMVDSVRESGEIESNEATLVQNAIDLSDIEVFEIMTPRVDIYGLEINSSLEEAIKDDRLFVHSRIPVYEGSMDNILGFISLRQLEPLILKGEHLELKDLLMKVVKVPRSRQVLDLLDEFKSKKIHLAVIMDEYGGTEGIVTMEDILEEIVGEIFDESDKIIEEINKISPCHYILDGGVNIDDFFELVGLINENEIETNNVTVSGFILEQLDRFPKVNDVVKINNVTCKVIECDKFTVKKLDVKIRHEHTNRTIFDN